MKPPDDVLARKARLRVEHVEAFMREDWGTYHRTARELLDILKAEGMPMARTYDRRGFFNRLNKQTKRMKR